MSIYKARVCIDKPLKQISVSRGLICCIDPEQRPSIFDGIKCDLNDLILVCNQSTSSINGIYKIVQHRPFQLSRKFNLHKKPACNVYVVEGIDNKHTFWSSIRRTKAKNVIDFQKNEAPSQMPPIKDDHIFNRGDQTERSMESDQKVMDVDPSIDIIKEIDSDKLLAFKDSPFSFTSQEAESSSSEEAQCTQVEADRFKELDEMIQAMSLQTKTISQRQTLQEESTQQIQLIVEQLKKIEAIQKSILDQMAIFEINMKNLRVTY